MKKLNYEDYKNETIDSIQVILLNKVLELTKKIIEEKNINLEKYSYIDNKYERLYHMFYYDVNLCSDLGYLLKELGIEYETNTYSKEDIKNCFYRYNELIEEFNNYLTVKKEIEEKSFKVLYDELKDSIKKLCIEMLEYKNKIFDKNASFSTLLKKIEQYYHTQIYSISILKTNLAGFAPGPNIDEEPKTLNHTETIMESRKMYAYIKSSYKEGAFDYRDYELEENETFSDLHLKKLERSFELYREMLDFLKVPYDKQKPPIHVINLVKEYYPFYIDYIDDKDKPYYDPYASLLTRMDEYYEYMSKNYKIDFIKEINRYQKYKFKEPTLSKEKLINDLNMTEQEINKIEELINEKIDVEDTNKDYEMSEELFNKTKEKFNELEENEKEILEYRFGINSNEKHSVEETAYKFNVSKLKVKQIEARAIRKIVKGRI